MVCDNDQKRNFKAVGNRIPRLDAIQQVQGKMVYGYDFSRPGILYGKLVLSEVAHGRIKKLDSSPALELKGVIDILTSNDIPKNSFGYLESHRNQPVLAGPKVRYQGEPIAAILAETEEIATKAAKAIEVEYEEMQPLLAPDKARNEKDVLIHEGKESNVAFRVHIERGDIEEGFAKSDKIFTDSYYTPIVEHAHLEPHAAVAEVDDTGKLTIWASVQRPAIIEETIARVLQLSQHNIRIVATPVGGGFGGKNEITIEPIAALFSFRNKKPVKMVYDREEEFTTSTVRHPYQMFYKTGVSKKGRILARQVTITSDCGAYVGWGFSTLEKATIHAAGPYQIPNVAVDSELVYTNKVPGGAMRGFGAPQVAYAYEIHTDRIARELKIDPLEFRRMNCYKDGSTTPTGQKLERVTLYKLLEKISEKRDTLNKKKKNKTSKKGLGIAQMQYPVGFTSYPNPSAAVVKINPDGTVTVLTGATDVGQGSTTALTQIAAEELGVSIERIGIVTADTEKTPYDCGTCASRVTYISGNAVKNAAHQAKNVILKVAANELDTPRRGLDINDGIIYLKQFPKRQVPLAEIAKKCYHDKGVIPIGKGEYNPSTTILGEDRGQGKPYEAYTYGVQLAEVEVDAETGQVSVNEIVAIHDCGRAINPMLLEGQIDGGVSMGIGYALYEKMCLDENGKVINPQFTDYVLPTVLDTPEITSLYYEDPGSSEGPFGAKGVAEATLLPTAPAIVNAIYDAIGVQIKDLPATPEKILKALNKL